MDIFWDGVVILIIAALFTWQIGLCIAIIIGCSYIADAIKNRGNPE